MWKKLDQWTDEHPDRSLTIVGVLCVTAAAMAVYWQPILPDGTGTFLCGVMFATMLFSFVSVISRRFK